MGNKCSWEDEEEDGQNLIFYNQGPHLYTNKKILKGKKEINENPIYSLKEKSVKAHFSNYRSLLYTIKKTLKEKREINENPIYSLKGLYYREKNKESDLENLLKNYSPYMLSKQTSIPNFQLLKNYISIQKVDDETVTAKNIAKYALPIVAYIHTVQPDFIVACDRGARPLGLAVAALYRKMHGRLPTTDGTLRFRRISTSNREEETEAHLSPLFAEMCETRDAPKVLILDDWVNSGATKQLVERIAERLAPGKVTLQWGVLCGSQADVTGDQARNGGWTDWHDNPEVIGVDYQGTKARVVRAESARKWRQEMHDSIDELLEGSEQISAMPRETREFSMAI